MIHIVLIAAGPMSADEPARLESEFGILNPDDVGRSGLIRKIDMGVTDSVTCSLAFNSTKYDDHANARRIATACAEAGRVKAMIWMSHLDSNGIGGPVDLAAAAQWNLRAAEADDPVGQFNYGLDLLRGSGVDRDIALGHSFVDAAAAQGLERAQALVAADYDLDAITPDADEPGH